MNDLDLAEPTQVSSFGFNVPCREFIIAAQVTRDKRMPMVDEFALRALHLCESVSVSRLARFFGFSQTEMEIVLADLQARTLITLEGNEVSLHSTGKELFRTSGDGQPVITDVESFPARIWFDLISKNMIRSRGLHNVKNLISLTPSLGRVDIPESFAREAFHDNFRDYLRLIRRIKNPEAWGLYAICDVAPGRFSYAQISGKQALVLGGQPKLETTLIETETDRPQKLRLLTRLCQNPGARVGSGRLNRESGSTLHGLHCCVARFGLNPEGLLGVNAGACGGVAARGHHVNACSPASRRCAPGNRAAIVLTPWPARAA